MIRSVLSILFIFGILLSGAAQPALPQFSIVNKGNNRILLSWTNPYGANIRQLSIQRSFDSLKNFKTIASLPDPTIPQNGILDTKATNDHMYYRLYILLDSGKYLFSPSAKPLNESLKTTAKKEVEPSSEQHPREKMEQNIPVPPHKNNPPAVLTETKPAFVVPEKFYRVKRRDSLIMSISEKNYKLFRDSILYKTKDTLLFKGTDTILLKPFIPKEIYKPSRFVFSEKNGPVKIVLPDAGKKQYHLKFYEMNDSLLFEIKAVKEPLLILEKSNFIHAGWFKFELYEEGILKERHRLQIMKDF